MEWYQITDIGKVRDQNEDYVLVDEALDEKGILGIVCDGMGGCLAGEVASEEAAEMMRSAFAEQISHQGGGADIHTCMISAVKRANARVWHLSASEDEYMGMGTTLTAVWTDGNGAWFVSVGDSRGYVFSDGRLTQITEDQSFVWDLYKQGAITKEQMLTHPMNHLVSMAVGLKPDVSDQDIGVSSRELSPGEVIMLCSDGVTDVLTEDHITTLIKSSDSLETLGNALVDECNRTSGKDNISVVLIRV